MGIEVIIKDQFFRTIREPAQLLTLNRLSAKLDECVECANSLIDEIDNNLIQPIHPNYKIQYLLLLKKRLLEVLDENYKFDESRIVNNCKTYAKSFDKFDHKNDTIEWKDFIEIAKTHKDFTGSDEAHQSIENFEQLNYTIPRISLPHLNPTSNDVKAVFKNLIDANRIIEFQDCLDQLPINGYPNDLEFNSYLQTLLQFSLSDKKSSLLWRLIGQVTIKLELLETLNGLTPVFIDPDKIPIIINFLSEARIINDSGGWMGLEGYLKTPKPQLSVYALIQTLYNKGYLKHNDCKQTRKAFISFFKINIKERTYSRITDLPSRHGEFLDFFQKYIPDLAK